MVKQTSVQQEYDNLFRPEIMINRLNKINRPGIGVPFGGGSQSWESYWASKDWGNYVINWDNIISTKSTVIVSTAPTANYGGLISIIAGEHNVNVDKIYRILIDFDFTSVPDSFSGAKLVLYNDSNSANNTRKIQIFKLKRSWTEGTRVGTGVANGATWNTYDGLNNWTAAGGFHADDCEQTPIAELEIAHDYPINQYVEIPFTVTTKAAITNGYGWLIKMETEDADSHTFRSDEHATYKPYLKIITSSPDGELINGTQSPLLTKSLSNPLFTGYFGSIVYNGVGDYVFYQSLLNVVNKLTSTDGINWTDQGTVLSGAGGKAIDVISAWKESDTWYMLYRSNEWGGAKAIGLATSADGTTWTKEATNPIITNVTIGAWCTGDIDPWGIIKVGATYYLWVNDVEEIPRQSGLMTSTDLINWTPDANNPIFTDGRYCPTVIKYGSNYYMFLPYTPLGNIAGADPCAYRIELYKDSDPRFLSTSREYLGVVLAGGEDGEWDDDYLDTPSIVTETIQKDTFPLGTAENGKLWMYYTGHSGTVWAHGLAVGHLEMLDQLTALTEPGAGE